MMLGLFILDYWWMMLPGLLLGIYAQVKLMSTFSKYEKVPASSGLTGAEAARRILDDAGLQDVGVFEVEGRLTDHYDPTKRALFLSTDNFSGNSLSAIGVSAHEAGHALQHKVDYAPLKWRMMLVPAMGFANMAYLGISVLGLFLGMRVFYKFLGIIIGIFATITLFQLITLPVEFDASSRAKKQLARLGLVRGEEEAAGVSKVLGAAAMTYVAALVSSVFELLKFVMIARDRD